MKKLKYILVLLILVSSCQENKNSPKKQIEKQVEKKEEPVHTYFHRINATDSILTNWVNYYKTYDTTFSIKNFEHKFAQPFTRMPGTVHGNFHEEFNPVYEPFLMHSPNNKFYVDIDSYTWEVFVDRGKEEVSFAPDQEINLVSKDKKTVTRIDFRGPSEWVEDAFWVNDSIVVLLENSDEKIPALTLIRLFDDTKEYYRYKDTLNFKSGFSQKRLAAKGLKVD